jgi:hypothetical protein
MNEDFDFEDLFRGPNDGAYEKEEQRTGPPLDYVAEKFRRSIELTHYLLNLIPTSNALGADAKDLLLAQAEGALRYQLTGYLALKNLLALVNEPGFFERVRAYSRDDFRDWLDRIDQQGSVHG